VKTGKVVVVGSFMMDLIAYAPRRPLPGETLMGSDFSMLVGGKGFNQAVAAVRAGAETSMVGRIGQDAFGEAFEAAMIADGIDATHVVRDAKIGTGVGLPVVEPSGQNSIVIVPRANYAMTAADVERASEVIAQADVILLQFELPVDVSLAAARIAHEHNTLVVLNPAPSIQVRGELVGITDILVPNEPEAAQLLGLEPSKLDPPKAAVMLFERWALSALVLTMGDQGVLLTTRTDTTTIPPHRVDVIDTIGAGDAFCGALAAAIAAGRPLSDAATFANAAGALSVTDRGGAPAMPRLAAINNLLARSGSELG
jgi:ribokinase